MHPLKGNRVGVTGHRGMAGSADALVDLLQAKPDGTPRKLMSADKLRAMGWSPRIGLRAGVEETYRWFLEHAASGTAR
jgi:dTDP-D-glucose 4,6-dehydratase